MLRWRNSIQKWSSPLTAAVNEREDREKRGGRVRKTDMGQQSSLKNKMERVSRSSARASRANCSRKSHTVTMNCHVENPQNMLCGGVIDTVVTKPVKCVPTKAHLRHLKFVFKVFLKGIVHSKMKNHPCVFQNPSDFLSMEHRGSYF